MSLIVQDRAYLIRRLGDLRRYGYSDVRIRPNAHATSWRERVVVDESVLVTLIDAFDHDLAEIDNCQPWGHATHATSPASTARAGGCAPPTTTTHSRSDP